MIRRSHKKSCAGSLNLALLIFKKTGPRCDGRSPLFLFFYVDGAREMLDVAPSELCIVLTGRTA